MTVPTLGEGQYWEHLTWGEGEGGGREGRGAGKQAGEGKGKKRNGRR